jgi:hypothetical protein
MPDAQVANESRIMLPLRTSVDLFSDPTQPSALTRAKQAAALYDKLIVEVGYFDVSVTQHGASNWWTPPERITAEQIAHARRPPEQGAPMAVAFGVQPGPGIPAETMHTVISGPISMAYGAEWHSEVLAPLHDLGADFIEPIAIGGGDLPRSHPVGKIIADQNFRDMGDQSIARGRPTFERDYIYKSFNHDAAIAEDLGAALQVSTLFTPMLERNGWRPTGATAIEIAAPNLAGLEWEQVLEFRQHPGAGEARETMREFERLAIEQEPGDANDFLMKVSQQTTAGLFAAFVARDKSLRRTAAEELARSGIGFIPVVGPFLGGVISVGEAAAQQRRESHSGIAALMKLQS